MSSQYDVFDNLNDYLNANDDCDFPDEALEDLPDQEPDPDEIPPPVKQKRGRKKAAAAEPDPTIPPKRTRRRTAAAAAESVSLDSSDDEDDLLLSDECPSTSNSQSSLRSQSRPPPKQQAAFDLPSSTGGDLDQQFNEVQRQYDLIYNNSPLIQENGGYFQNLKKRWQTLLKQRRSPRGFGSKTFMSNLEQLQEIFYNICVNRNLMPSGTVFSTVGAGTSSASAAAAPATGRRRRQQQPELINLVDSPALVLPGTINLDSDTEEDLPSQQTANVSFDSENYEVSVKVKWEGRIEKFQHRKFQKFADMIAKLAEKSDSDPAHVVLNLDERIIEPDDTPDSIGYRISQFITGRVVRGKLAEMFSKKEPNVAGSTKQKKPVNANVIDLKVQSDRWKKPLEVQIGKDQKMMIVVIKCAEELKCKPGDIKLNFDGDPLPMDSTPEDLDLDGGEVLDLRFLKG